MGGERRGRGRRSEDGIHVFELISGKYLAICEGVVVDGEEVMGWGGVRGDGSLVVYRC